MNLQFRPAPTRVRLRIPVGFFNDASSPIIRGEGEFINLGIGCSDAHLASHICACVTRFEAVIRHEGDLVEALMTGEFRPVWLEDTREAD